jgi:type II secretory pathway component PulM
MAAFSFKEIPLFNRAKTGLDGFEPRERTFIGIGVVFLVCFFLLQFVLSPYIGARQRLARSLAAKKADLEKIVQLQKEYRLLRITGGTDGRPSGQTAGFSLFSFVEEQAVHAKIKQQILSMKPTTTETEDHAEESIVEMKLQKITLGQLVGFLKLIESTEKAVMVRHISIQESDETYLDVNMQIVMVVKKP